MKPSQILAKHCDEFWDEVMQANPVWATSLGVRDFDAALPDGSEAARAQEAERLAKRKKDLECLDLGELSVPDQITLQELRHRLEKDLSSLEANLEDFNLSHMMGPPAFLQQLPALNPIRSFDEVQSYLARLGQLPGMLATEVDNLSAGLKRDRVASRGPAQRCLSQAKKLASAPISDWALGRPLAKEIPGVDPELLAPAREEVARLIQDEVAPALARYADFLEQEILPRARSVEEPGLCHLPGGKEAYQALAKVHTSLETSFETIHALGKEEVDRGIEKVCELGAKLFGTSSHAEIQARLRQDPELHFQSPDEIVATANAAIRRAEAQLPRLFGSYPKEPCEVLPVPEDLAPDATIGYYRGPSPDGSLPGRYFVNTYRPEIRARFEAEVLAFHEAVPGHHLQISLASGLDQLPEFRRHGGTTATVEGWALYAEKLSDEEGLFASDLDRLGALYFDLKRSCRLVVDSGIHGLGWTRDQALDYMRTHSLMHGEAVEVEVDRYTVMPGQALSYKMGQLEILRLRQRAKESLGGAFSLSDFHDRLLSPGAVTLGTLAEWIESWVLARLGAGLPPSVCVP